MRYAYVMLTSLLENQESDVEIHVYILYSDLLREEMESIQTLFEKNNGFVHYIYIDKNNLPESLPVTENWSLEAYYRLFMMDVLPKEVDRIIYLDVDIIILRSLKEMYHTDLGDNLIGACKDCCEKPFGDDRDIIFNEHMKKEFTYVSSGVLLLDLTKLRQKYKPEDYFKLAEKMEYKLLAPDQDLLNYMHWNEISLLDGNKYNFFAKVAYNHDIHYNEVKGYVTIVHYIGCKPWEGQYVHYDIEQLWWDYAKKTPYYIELMEEYIKESIGNPLIYDTMCQLHEEKISLSDQLAKSLDAIKQLMAVLNGQ
jgi:lipopolysaccharide biosynthesis glycosyltransferase